MVQSRQQAVLNTTVSVELTNTTLGTNESSSHSRNGSCIDHETREIEEANLCVFFNICLLTLTVIKSVR